MKFPCWSNLSETAPAVVVRRAFPTAPRAARMGSNIVNLDTAEETRDFADTFRDVWMEHVDHLIAYR